MTTILNETIFDTLSALDINNKVKTWKIKVENYGNYSEIVTEYGYSKMVEKRQKIDKGKNLGKSNATDHYSQAIIEAKSKLKKKIDIEKYHTKINNQDNPVITSENVKLPMLAHDYKKHAKKVKFPCAIQFKLDGFRALFNTTLGSITTRQGKSFDIVKQSNTLYKELQNLPNGYIFDGEFFTSSINFETLGVLRKTKTMSKIDLENLNKIEYHIYDIIDTTLTFQQRNEILQNIFSKLQFTKILQVETIIVNNEDEILENHSRFLKDGYEGTIIRNLNGLYKCKTRSTDLLKYKDFQDAEFPIVDYTVEIDTSGNNENLVVWIIQVNENITCKVRPQGAHEERKELYKKCVNDFSQFKNKKLWTKFFEYTKDKSLRFPTTMRTTFNDYIRENVI